MVLVISGNRVSDLSPLADMTGLRELYRMLEGLAEEYEKAAAELPRRFGYCESFARECRNGTETVHRLLRRAMGEENRTDAG